MNGAGSLTVRVYNSYEDVIIEIEDNGPGIPEDIQHRIFDSFFTTKEAGHGTGLGLSVPWGIMAQLGGSLWLESDEGSGTTFKSKFLQRWTSS